MKYKDAVKNILMLYSDLYRSRLDIDDHLFAVIGNGYEWKDGQLIENETDTTPLSKIDAMEKCILRSREIEHIAMLELIGWNLDNKDEDEDSRLVSFAKHMVSYVRDELKEECERIKSVDSSYRKYKHIPMEFEKIGKISWNIYPICEYSKLVTFPDDIKPDWAKALYKFVCWCLKHTEYLDNEYGFDKQLEYLKNSKERLEKIIYGNI